MRKLLLTFSVLLISVFAAHSQTKTGVKYNQYGVAVESDVLDAEAQDGFLVIESPKSDYKIWFDNRIQFDAGAFFGAPDYADPIGNGVSIRRARFAIKAQVDSRMLISGLMTEAERQKIDLLRRKQAMEERKEAMQREQEAGTVRVVMEKDVEELAE